LKIQKDNNGKGAVLPKLYSNTDNQTTQYSKYATRIFALNTKDPLIMLKFNNYNE